MRPSIRQVADYAGVSRTTVSNIIRGRDDQTSTETRTRVLEAVRVLNYIPVAGPTTQRRHVETRVIGAVFDHIDPEDEWGSPTFNGLRAGAKHHGYDLLTLLRAEPGWMADQEEMMFLDRRSDALIFVVPINRYKVLDTLVKHEIPVVSCYISDVPPAVPSVVLEDARAMQMATELLLSKGHRRIAHLAGSETRSDFRERHRGYTETMAAHSLEALSIPLRREGNLPREWEQELLAAYRNNGVTAVVACTDTSALRAWRCFENAGLRVPEDVSIIGMDDVPAAADKGLTTLRISGASVGRRAVDMVMKLLAGETLPEERVVVPVEMVERTSVVAIAKM